MEIRTFTPGSVTDVDVSGQLFAGSRSAGFVAFAGALVGVRFFALAGAVIRFVRGAVAVD